MKTRLLIILCYTSLLSLSVIGCKKEEADDKIDRFIESFSGTYTERECGNGGPVQGSIELEDARLQIRKTGALSAELLCTHTLLGELFKCNAVYETDSTLTIPGVVLDGRELKGLYRISQAANSQFVLLYDSLVVCRSFGGTAANISFGVYH